MTVVDLHFGGKQQVSKRSLGSANFCLIVFISATLHYVVNALTNCANKFFFLIQSPGNLRKIISLHMTMLLLLKKFLQLLKNYNFNAIMSSLFA